MSFRALENEILRREIPSPLRDRVNKRREFIVSLHLYMRRMHDRWHGTCLVTESISSHCRLQREIPT